MHVLRHLRENMESPLPTQIRLISPSSREGEIDWDVTFRYFEKAGLSVSYHKLEADPSWPFHASSVQKRAEQLLEALFDGHVSYILACRGGYGASDLLDLIPWDHLRKAKPKTLVGFSDISALHSAFFTQLGWLGIHGPMPATSYWQTGTDEDVESLLAILAGKQNSVSMPLLYLGRGFTPKIEGWAFGGCLSVLTNLIGTPYFPESLEGAIVYWEDIGEHPARILRMINQWMQSGALKGAKGIILGRFVDCFKEGLSTEALLIEEIANRLRLPVWHTPYFGHCSPNWPLPVGAGLRVDQGTLIWEWKSNHGI